MTKSSSVNEASLFTAIPDPGSSGGFGERFHLLGRNVTEMVSNLLGAGVAAIVAGPIFDQGDE
jgi:hypothetical protein